MKPTRSAQRKRASRKNCDASKTHLNRLVRPTGDEPRPGFVEGGAAGRRATENGQGDVAGTRKRNRQGETPRTRRSRSLHRAIPAEAHRRYAGRAFRSRSPTWSRFRCRLQNEGQRRKEEERVVSFAKGNEREARDLEGLKRLKLVEPRLTSREHDSLLVHAHGVDDGVVTGEVVNECSLGTLPLFDAASANQGESVSDNFLSLF